MGGDGWLSADPTWTQPLKEAMRNGTPSIRLQHTYQNKYGENVISWYTIDCADATTVTQMNEATSKKRVMRLVQLMAPPLVQPPVVARPPPEPSADVAGAADTQEPPADVAGAADTQEPLADVAGAADTQIA